MFRSVAVPVLLLGGANLVSSQATPEYVAGYAQRVEFSTATCEADPCLSVCTNAFQDTITTINFSAGLYKYNINGNTGSSYSACSCSRKCSWSLTPDIAASAFSGNPPKNPFDALAQVYAARGTTSLTLNCTDGASIITSVVPSFQPGLQLLQMNFSAGFLNTTVGPCSATYAVLNDMTTQYQWFLNLTYATSADLPTGVGTQVAVVPSSLSSTDACFVACTSKAAPQLYYNARGQRRLYYEWSFAPAPGTGLPPGCTCSSSNYSCMYASAAGVVPDYMGSAQAYQALQANTNAPPAPMLATGVPLLCGALDVNGLNPGANFGAETADLVLTAQVLGSRTALVASWLQLSRSVYYAVTAGWIFNVTVATSVAPGQSLPALQGGATQAPPVSTGFVKRVEFGSAACEADPCLSYCTVLYENTVQTQSAASGAFTYSVGAVGSGSSTQQGCNCAQRCSWSLSGAYASAAYRGLSAPPSSPRAALARAFQYANSTKLSLACADGTTISTAFVPSFAPDLQFLQVAFPAGYLGTSVGPCNATYAVLQQYVTVPGYSTDWFLNLTYNTSADPPRGVGTQAAMVPSSVASTDACFAACTSKVSTLVYRDLYGMGRLFYQWSFSPVSGASVPAGCVCDPGLYSCVHTTAAKAITADDLTYVQQTGDLQTVLVRVLAQQLIAGVPFLCGNKTSNTSDPRVNMGLAGADIVVTAQAFGSRTALVASWPQLQRSIYYAVTAGWIFNTTLGSSISLGQQLPIEQPAAPAAKGLSDQQRSAIIGCSIAGAAVIALLCGTLVYMARKERSGEPVFARLEDVVELHQVRPEPR